MDTPSSAGLPLAAHARDLLVWLDEREAHRGLGDAMATVVELRARLAFLYEPAIGPVLDACAPLADRLAERVDSGAADAPDAALLSDFWRLVAAVVWATIRHHRNVRLTLGVPNEVGAETLKQQRFSIENVHEAWALTVEGFYEPAAVDETTAWLIGHVRDAILRDLRLGALERAPRRASTAPDLGPDTSWDTARQLYGPASIVDFGAGKDVD